MGEYRSLHAMAALVAGIHVFLWAAKTWMADPMVFGSNGSVL
jgi:hypothetical protein